MADHRPGIALIGRLLIMAEADCEKDPGLLRDVVLRDYGSRGQRKQWT